MEFNVTLVSNQLFIQNAVYLTGSEVLVVA